MRFARKEASRLIQKDKKRDYCAQMQGEGASATSFLRLPSMKIPRMLATLLVSLTILAAIVMATGYLLPPDRTGHAARSIDAPPARVRAVILAVERQPLWRSGLALVERGPDGTWTEVRIDGERIAFRMTEQSDNRLALRFDSSRGYSGSWQAGLHADATGGTAMHVAEQSTIASPIGRILSRLFFAPDAFAARYLDELAAEVSRQAGKGD